MDVCVYKDNILEENFYIIESSPKYELYGINLTKLYNSKKTFLIYTTDCLLYTSDAADEL